MKAIDILARVDCIHDTGRIETGGQRQLHQNAVHGLVVVEQIDQRQQVRLAGRCRQVVRERGDAGLGRRLAFVAHVNAGGGIRSHLHDGEPGGRPNRPASRARVPPPRRALSPRRLCHRG